MQVELEFQRESAFWKPLDRSWLADYARRVTALAHPSLLRVFDVLTNEQGRWVLVRQATGGNWLRPSRVSDAARDNLPLACSLVLTLAEALAYLHQVLFRGGISLSWSDSVRCDHEGDDWSVGLFPPTPPDIVLADDPQIAGVPGYIAPELLLSPAAPSPASDSFTLGAALFEVLCGERLIRARQLMEQFQETVAGGFRTLAEVRAGIPDELSAFVAKAVDLEPAKRPSLREWAFVMERFGGRVLPLPGPPKGPGKLTYVTYDEASPPPRLTSVLPAGDASRRLRVLREHLGHGGMSSTWQAEWEEPQRSEMREAAAPPRGPVRFGDADLPPEDSADTDQDEPDTDEENPPPYLDENVQFTVYRPEAVRPAKWYTMLAFAHLAERPPDAPPDEPSPIEKVKSEAEKALGDRLRDYRDVTQDSLAAVPREGEITLVPEMAGVEFNPPRCSFLWVEDVHRVDFRLRASPKLDGATARGRLTVFLGSIILADIPLSIRVDGQAGSRPGAEPRKAEHCRPYRRIFASYSHNDLAVVAEFERYAAALGDRYLRDWVDLRAGEAWGEGLARMIEEADVFQLFWSRHSMGSPFVRQEWEHALGLGREHFVRPVYWEEPLPEDRERGLPPDELRRLHFQRILGEGGAHLPAEPMPQASATGKFTTEGLDMAAPVAGTKSHPAGRRVRYFGVGLRRWGGAALRVFILSILILGLLWLLGLFGG